jgi:hypothetical protein
MNPEQQQEIIEKYKQYRAESSKFRPSTSVIPFAIAMDMCKEFYNLADHNCQQALLSRIPEGSQSDGICIKKEYKTECSCDTQEVCEHCCVGDDCKDEE